MKFELTILGSSSATPIHGRNPSAQLLNINEKFYLIDCGEGTQQQLLRFELKASKIDTIFISHLHGDHYLGLMGLLSSMHLVGRTKSLMLFGPPELHELLQLHFMYSATVLRYPLIFKFTHSNSPAVILENSDVVVETIILNHRIHCTGFKFTTKSALPTLREDKVLSLAIPVAHRALIKKGFPFTDASGVVHPADSLTLPQSPPKSYAYCSDTLCDGSYASQVEGVELLYHESTFLHDMLDRANETYHTTALQAATLATNVGVRRLIIGHFSARYKELTPLLEEAQSVFMATQLAIEGETFSI
jgi:ribonuclease Z